MMANTKLDIVSALLLSAAISVIVLVIFELTSPKRNQGEVWKVIGYLALFLILIEHIIDFSGYQNHFPYFEYISTPLFFLYIASLYLSLRNYNKESKYGWMLHLVVPLIVLIIMVPTYITSHKATHVEVNGRDPLWFVGLYFLHFLFYMWKIVRLVLYRRQELLQHYANPNVHKERFILLISLSVVLFAFSFPVTILFQYISIDWLENTERWFVLLFSLNAHLALYITLLNGRNENFRIDHETKPVKQVDLDIIEGLKLKLLAYLSETKDYLNPDLTLEALSKSLDTNRSTLSLVINKGLKSNFYELINGYRIEEAKKKLTNVEFKKYSLDYLAKECGFNSYASFYRVFKRVTGVTPSQYLKSD